MRTFPLLPILAFLFTVACGGSNEASPPAPPVAEKASEEPSPEPQTPESPAAKTAPDKAIPKGDPVAGKSVYGSKCVACHQADGTGMGGALGADFVNDPTRKAKSDAELFASIENGVAGTTMIAWGPLLEAQDRADVLAYIRGTFMK